MITTRHIRVFLICCCLGFILCGCATGPQFISGGTIPAPEYKLPSSSKPCYVRVKSPSELCFSASHRVYTYAGRELVEQIFQKHVAKRYAPSSAAAGASGMAEVDVHSIIVSKSGRQLKCTATLRCVLRDYNNILLFNELYKETASSRFNGLEVPMAVKGALGSIAKRFLSDISNDPVVLSSSLGGSDEPLHHGQESLPSIVVRAFEGEASKTYAIDELFMSEFMRLGFGVISSKDRDKAIKEINVSSTGFFDQKTTVELGKFLSARYLVTGSCQVNEREVTINVRINDSEKADVTAAASGTCRNSARLVKACVRDLSNKLKKLFKDKMGSGR